MKTGIFASIIAVAAMAGTPIAADAQDSALVFKPAGPWAIDYGDDYCRLGRKFMNGTTELDVALERIQPGTPLRLIVLSDAINTYRSATQIGWHFLPADAERKAFLSHGQTATGQKYFNLGQVTLAPFVMPAPGAPLAPPPPYSRDDEQATGKGITGLMLDSGVVKPVEVDTESLAAPVTALQACADDLAKSWGLDPAKLKGATPAIPNGGGVGWLPQGTIDFGDFAKLSGGANQVRLMVDATGKPTECHVHWPSLDKNVNDKICATLMTNAKFTPAKDAGGQPMPGYWVGDPLFMGPPMKGFGGH